MEINKEYLQKKKAEYLQAAEQAKLNSIANSGAADAIDALIAELDKPEETKTDKP